MSSKPNFTTNVNPLASINNFLKTFSQSLNGNPVSVQLSEKDLMNIQSTANAVATKTFSETMLRSQNETSTWGSLVNSWNF